MRYAKFFWTGGLNGQLVGLPPSEEVNNVSVAYHDLDLAALTRRIQCISDTSMFTHFRQSERHSFDRFIAPDAPAPGAPSINQRSFLRCNDLTELGRWLLDCRPLLEAGDVFYYPDITTTDVAEYSDGFGDTARSDRELSVANLTDVIVANGKIVDQGDSLIKKSSIIYPILRVDLPFVDETSMATFASMAIDHRGALERARDTLRAKFLELEGAMGEEKLETAIAKLSIEVKGSIREIDSEYGKFRRGSAFAMSGASLGTVSATLALSTAFAEGAGILGAGGGLIALAKALESHFEQKASLRGRDMYFFWILDRERRKELRSK